MKKDPLDDLLNRLQREKPPASPPSLETNVLRSIRLRQAEGGSVSSLFSELLGTIWRPGFAVTVLALVVATSTATTVIAAEFSGRGQARADAPAWATEAIDIQLLKHSDSLLDCCRPSASHGRQVTDIRTGAG